MDVSIRFTHFAFKKWFLKVKLKKALRCPTWNSVVTNNKAHDMIELSADTEDIIIQREDIPEI